MLSLVGAIGAFSAPIAGRLADKKDTTFVISISAVFILASFLIFWRFEGSILSIVIGVLVMDIAIQFAFVSNQARIYAIDPMAKSRLNTIFMTVMFLGGSIGAGIGSIAYQYMGWEGVCLYGGIASIIALLISFGKK